MVRTIAAIRMPAGRHGVQSAWSRTAAPAEEVRIVAEEDCAVAFEGARTAAPWERNACADRLRSLPVVGGRHGCAGRLRTLLAVGGKHVRADRLHSHPVVEEKQNHVGAQDLRWRLALGFRGRWQAVSCVPSSLCGVGNLCRLSRRSFCVD